MSPTEESAGDGKPQVLPFYVLCDESQSMTGPPVKAINDALPRLHQAVREDFDVDEMVRFGLIAFADDAEETLPLCELGSIDTMPGLAASGTTDYGAAFRALKQAINRDVPTLQGQGYEVLRPVAFLLSDGCPNGGLEGAWISDYTPLVDPDFAFHPHIIAFGIGDADPQVIAQVATLRAYQADDNTDPADAVKEWATRLTQSVVASARSVAQGGAALVVPPTPDGFQQLPLEALPAAASA